jgi:FAD/FMN-containing dehydrogenase
MDGYAEAAATVFATGTPDVVVRPADAGEVAAALRYAAEGGLTVSVRSGGHSVAGLSTHADGMVIDLRRISRVEVIDQATRRVRIGAGATWGAVAAALQPHGLGITAGDTNQVGVGGLTLGGGIGWMIRRYGLAIDSLAGADLVTADGRLLHAGTDHHSDLFWALRGGGGNFGVVVSFDFVAQPVTSVHYGLISYQPGDLPQLIQGRRDLMRASDENLTITLTLTAIMPGPSASATLQCCYACLDRAAAARALDPFRQLTTVASDDIRAIPYANILENVHPAGVRIEARNTLVPDLGDELIAAIEELLGSGGAVLTLRSLGGAFSRVPPDATAFAHRDAEAMLVAGMLLPADPGTRAGRGNTGPVGRSRDPRLGGLRQLRRISNRGRPGSHLPAGHPPAPGGGQTSLRPRQCLPAQPQHLPRSQLNEPAAPRRRYRTRAVSAADPAVRRISDCIDGQEVLW